MMQKLLGTVVLGLIITTNAFSEIITLKCDGKYATRYAVIDLDNKKLGFEKSMPRDLNWEIVNVSNYEIVAEKLFMRKYTDGHIYKSTNILIINRINGQVTDDRRVEQINKNPDANYDSSGIPVTVIPKVVCEPFSGEAKF